jgi:hypothetical protein
VAIILFGSPLQIALVFSETSKGAFPMGRGLLLWLIGIPIPIILLIWLFGGLHG